MSADGVYGINVFASEIDWRVSVFELKTGATIRTIEADPGGLHVGVPDPLIDHLRDAFATLKNSERELCGAVYLCVDDPTVELLDNRMLQFPNPDDPRVADFIRELTGEEQCAFDRVPFGVSSNDEVERCVYAIIPLVRLKQILSITDRLAIAVRSISPIGASLLRVTQRHEGTPYGALYLGATSSTILVADAVAGSVVQRVIPVGTLSLASALAAANSVPQEEAIEALRRRNLIAKIPAPPKFGDAASNMGGSTTQNALQPEVWRLRQAIAETLDYFSAQRLVEPPKQLELHGNTNAVTGLVDWLIQHNDVAFVRADRSIFDAFAAQGTEKFVNLLLGTDQPLIVEGRNKYHFKNGRFESLESKTEAQPATFAAKQKAKSRTRGSARQRGSKEPEDQKKRLMMLIVAAILAGGFLLFDDNIAVVPGGRSAQIETMRSELAANTQLRARNLSLSNGQEQLPTTVRRNSQKILWTEKFFSISNSIPSGLWISDAFLVHNKRTVGGVEVVTTKLVLQGGADATTQDRLKEIATFISRLEADETFMRDFRRLTFEGTKALLDQPNSIINFEIHAWYDENKRDAAAGRTAKNGPGALGKMQKAVGARQQEQQNILEQPSVLKDGSS